MVKAKEKTYLQEFKEYPNANELIKHTCGLCVVTTDETTLQFEINERTSSCGSIQLMNMIFSKGYGKHNLTKTQRQEIFDKIVEDCSEFNHFFFIDMKDGHLDEFFGDLGFTNCWEYCNLNTEHDVCMWSYNKLTKEEVLQTLKDERMREEEEYYDEDDTW